MPTLRSLADRDDMFAYEDEAGSSAIFALALHRLHGWRIAAEMFDDDPNSVSEYFAIDRNDVSWDYRGCTPMAEREADHKLIFETDEFHWKEVGDEAALIEHAAKHDMWLPLDTIDNCMDVANAILRALPGYPMPAPTR